MDSGPEYSGHRLLPRECWTTNFAYLTSFTRLNLSVFEQCYTHRHLGWKINVHDECDAPQAAASQVREVYAEFPGHREDLEEGESVRVTSKVTPGPEYFQDHRIKNIRNPSFMANTNMNHHKTGDRIRVNQAGHVIRLSNINNQPPSFDAYDQRFKSLEDGQYTRGSLIIGPTSKSQSYNGGRTKLGQMDQRQQQNTANSQQKLITDTRRPVGKFTYDTHGAKTFTRNQEARRRRPNRPSISNSQRTVQNQYLTDRKIHNHRTIPSSHNRPISQISSKLTKTDFNQNTIESKMSVGSPQAKNTGFKPESVVVEGGFKPIIRITDVDLAEDRRFDLTEDEGLPDSGEYRPFDSFEPMFVPSPPDRNQSKKLKKKVIQSRRIKPRLEEADEDVMEAAADGIDAYYLPASSSILSQRPKALKPTDAGALVTADGTQVLDANLARSIPKVSEPVRSRVSSDALSRMPQFGRFRGELPPPIPGNVRTDGVPQLSGQRPSGNTRLALVERSKRSPHHVPGHEDDSEGETDARVTKTDQNRQHLEHDFDHDHAMHDHDHDHEHHHNATVPSAAEFLFANIQYLVLTAVLYFVI